MYFSAPGNLYNSLELWDSRATAGSYNNPVRYWEEQQGAGTVFDTAQIFLFTSSGSRLDF